MLQLPSLNEVILPGLTSIFILFMALRDARKAKSEVISSPPNTSPSASNSIVSGVSIAWDRDQQERLLQMVERMVRAQEKIAKSQEVLANKQQLDMQDAINELMQKMDHMPDIKR